MWNRPYNFELAFSPTLQAAPTVSPIVLLERLYDECHAVSDGSMVEEEDVVKGALAILNAKNLDWVAFEEHISALRIVDVIADTLIRAFPVAERQLVEDDIATGLNVVTRITAEYFTLEERWPDNCIELSRICQHHRCLITNGHLEPVKSFFERIDTGYLEKVENALEQLSLLMGCERPLDFFDDGSDGSEIFADIEVIPIKSLSNDIQMLFAQIPYLKDFSPLDGAMADERLLRHIDMLPRWWKLQQRVRTEQLTEERADEYEKTQIEEILVGESHELFSALALMAEDLILLDKASDACRVLAALEGIFPEDSAGKFYGSGSLCTVLGRMDVLATLLYMRNVPQAGELRDAINSRFSRLSNHLDHGVPMRHLPDIFEGLLCGWQASFYSLMPVFSEEETNTLLHSSTLMEESVRRSGELVHAIPEPEIAATFGGDLEHIEAMSLLNFRLHVHYRSINDEMNSHDHYQRFLRIGKRSISENGLGPSLRATTPADVMLDCLENLIERRMFVKALKLAEDLYEAFELNISLAELEFEPLDMRRDMSEDSLEEDDLLLRIMENVEMMDPVDRRGDPRIRLMQIAAEAGFLEIALQIYNTRVATLIDENSRFKLLTEFACSLRQRL